MMNRKRIIELRLLIARLGEKDLFGWWDSEALTTAGRVVLSRLFPKTGNFVGFRLSIDAARIAHDALAPELEAMTLFNLPLNFEIAIENYFNKFKLNDLHSQELNNSEEDVLIAKDDHELTIPSVVGGGENISSILVASGLLPPSLLDEIAPMKKSITGRLVCIGELNPGQEPTSEEYLSYIERLTAAYSFSSLGRLVVPYYLIKRR